MKALLDTNVLYPTLLRQILTGVAAAGGYRPLWSERILEEWARATRKLGPGAEDQARGEIAVLKAQYPEAIVPPAPGIEARLWLPDPADVHVLAAGIAGGADLIVTFNAADFPRATLAEHGIARMDPDQFLLDLRSRRPGLVEPVVEEVAATARRLSGEALPLRPLLKRARLPRLARALSAG